MTKDMWIELTVERVLSIDRGRDVILCDRDYPVTMLVKLTEVQKEAVSWARQTTALVRWPDGLWRGLRAQKGDDEFEHDDVVALVAMNVLRFTPLGATVVDGE